MHTEAYDAVERMSQKVPLPADGFIALDLGGQYVNGSARDIFPSATWTGLDIVAGPGIDIVADAITWAPDKEYNLVLCTEVLEHVEDWRGIVKTAHSALSEGGTLVLTCASTDRPVHGANGAPDLAPGEWYQNVGPEILEKYARELFANAEVEYRYPPGDAYLLATK